MTVCSVKTSTAITGTPITPAAEKSASTLSSANWQTAPLPHTRHFRGITVDGTPEAAPTTPISALKSARTVLRITPISRRCTVRPLNFVPTSARSMVTEQNIICHSEGYKQGVASNHGDVMHWFPKHGKSMDTFRAKVKALLAADTKENTEDTAEPVVTYPEKLTSGFYRVRKAWKDSKSQVGAYRVLANAKAAADKNPGTHVFTNDGVAIYPVDDATDSGTADYRIHTVVKGDTLWDIAALYLGKGSRYPEIKTLNGLKSNVIYSGWKLKIPN